MGCGLGLGVVGQVALEEELRKRNRCMKAAAASQHSSYPDSGIGLTGETAPSLPSEGSGKSSRRRECLVTVSVLCLSLCLCRPDMTFSVDWALNNNDLSISLSAWWAGWRAGWLAGWLAGSLPGWLTDLSLAGFLSACLSACLAGWLAGSLPG